MTWIKLDDKSPRHPKVASLTDRGFRWWIKGLCYASEFLTNGVLHPVFWKEVPKQSRAELTGQKLWDWEDPNFIIHDYLSHQQSRESVEKERRRNRDRRSGERRAEDVGTGGTAPGTTAGTTDGVTAGRTGEKPRPDTDTEVPQSRDFNTHTARARQTNGANALGSLPRDHRFHAVCGPAFRICLTEATAAKLAQQWGGDSADALPALREFAEWLEAKIGDGPKGDFLWLMRHFEAFMSERGREPLPPPAKAMTVKAAGLTVAAIDAWGE